MGSVKNMILLIGVMTMGYMLMVAESSPDTTINKWRCNTNSYSESDAYAANVEYIFGVLVSMTPNMGFYYNTQSPDDTDICYGLATCNSVLSTGDCSDCLAAARDAVKDICPLKIGGWVQMVDCTMRYENYYF